MMRLKTIVTALLFTFFSISIAAQPYTTEIPVQKNEHWWGLFVGESPVEQPFKHDFETDTHQFVGGCYVASAMVSNSGRYIWSEFPMTVKFSPSKITIISDHEKVKAEKGGNTLREACLVCNLKNVKPENGVTPSAYLFTNPVYDLRIEAGAVVTQEKVIDYAGRILDSGFPAGTILLPEGWESLGKTGEFNGDLYSDPKGMVDRLHAEGFKVMLTVTPYVPAAGLGFINASSGCALLTDTGGKTIVFETGFGYNACMDLTKKGAADHFNGLLQELKNRYGIDGFRLECHHILPHIAYDGSKFSDFIANWSDVGKGFDMVIYSTAYGGVSTSYINSVFGEDILSWSNVDKAMRSLPVLGLTGYSYSNFALGRISPGCSDDLIFSAVRLALAMPVAVLPPTMDFLNNSSQADYIKKALKARMDIASYMESLTGDTAKTTAPIIRHMEYQYPGQGFANCDDQFMIGSKYLVAPIADVSGQRTVRLPRGTWMLSGSSTTYKGPRVINISAESGSLVWFESKGR